MRKSTASRIVNEIKQAKSVVDVRLKEFCTQLHELDQWIAKHSKNDIEKVSPDEYHEQKKRKKKKHKKKHHYNYTNASKDERETVEMKQIHAEQHLITQETKNLEDIRRDYIKVTSKANQSNDLEKNVETMDDGHASIAMSTTLDRTNGVSSKFNISNTTGINSLRLNIIGYAWDNNFIGTKMHM